MPAILDKPRIQCQYQNADSIKCPLDAIKDEHYCKFHLPK